MAVLVVLAVAMLAALSTFPSASSAELAAALGVRYFVIHADQLGSDDARVAHAAASGWFKLPMRDGSDYLFEVVNR